MISPEKIITDTIHDYLNDWESGYKIAEDLPAIADLLTEEILKTLKNFKYKIMKEND